MPPLLHPIRPETDALAGTDPGRRRLLVGGALWALAGAAVADDAAERALRQGGVAVAFRHAHAPGTYDPPEFRIGDCSTQRNLDGSGRTQARELGAWFTARGLTPERVRSSPWCRCVDTATLAFGRAEPWAALGSPHNATATQTADALRAVRQALAALRTSGRGFEAWVTHMFLLSQLADVNLASGEGVVLRSAANGGIEVLARLRPA